MSERIEFGEEVRRALAARTPIVALETTLVTHGLPHPDGVDTAAALEQIRPWAARRPACAS